VGSVKACDNSPEELPEYKEPSVYEKYIKAGEALDAAGSMSANVYMKMTVSADGGAFVMETSGAVKTVALNKADMEMDAMLFINLSDGSGRHSTGWNHIYMAYYKDNYLYTHLQEMVTLNEQKYKRPVPAAEAARQVNIFEPITFLESSIKEVSESEAGSEPDNEFNADSGTLLRFLIDASTLNKTLDAMVDSKLGDLFGEFDGPSTKIKYGDLMLTVLLDEDGGMSNIRMSFPIESTVADGILATAEIEMRMGISQIGRVIINFPDDLDAYELMSESFEI